jgi:hypothetical protein
MQDARTLLEAMRQTGELSPEAYDVMESILDDSPPNLSSLPEVPRITRLTAVAILADNTPSMEECGEGAGDEEGVPNFQTLILAFNEVLWPGLKGAKDAPGIEVMVDLINPNPSWVRRVSGQRGDSIGWCSLDRVPNLVPSNYIAGDSTPLYERTVRLLTAVAMRLHQWEEEHGVVGCSRVLIVSDGEPTGDDACTEDDCATVIEAMQASGKHWIFFLGLKKAGVDFRKIARGMGISNEGGRIMEVPRSPKEIRRAISLFSQSASANANAAGNPTRDTAASEVAAAEELPAVSEPPAVAESAQAPAAPVQPPAEPMPSSGLDLGFGGVEQPPAR